MTKIYQVISYIIMLMLVSHFDLLSQVYVNEQAGGANDGTSSTNAFTGISDALATAPMVVRFGLPRANMSSRKGLLEVDKSLK